MLKLRPNATVTKQIGCTIIIRSPRILEVFRQTAMSHDRTFREFKGAHITIFLLFSIGHHTEDINTTLYSVILEMLKSVNNTYLI